MEQTMKIVKIDSNRKWISNKEAAKYLGVSKDWLKDRILDGRLHYSKVGNTIFFMLKEIDDLIISGAVSGKNLFKSA